MAAPAPTPPGASGAAEVLAGGTVAGVLSGTSADGIDVALAAPRFEDDRGRLRLAGLRLLAFDLRPFPGDLGDRVRRVLDGETPPLSEVAALHRGLGRAFGAAAREVADAAGERLALVASHGQTVFHHDGDPALAGVTLQLGDGCAAAEAAGCAVASDFRVRDCAAGGEGAPLVALVDDVLFADAPRPLAVLNLGGIANWTVLSGRAGEGARAAFDTGPAGALLDGLARARLGRPYDGDGAVAAAGRPDPDLLARLLDHPFLGREAPKTTGRDTFGPAWLAGVLGAGEHLRDADLLATGVAFIARHVADGLRRALGHSGGAADGESAPLLVSVGGGGVHNGALMGALRESLGAALGTAVGAGAGGLAGFGTTADLGVPPDAREALAFAVLGARLAAGEPSTDGPGGALGPTGALPGRVLGKWSPAPVLPARP